MGPPASWRTKLVLVLVLVLLVLVLVLLVLVQRSNERDLKISNHDYLILSSSLSNQNPPCYSILITLIT